MSSKCMLSGSNWHNPPLSMTDGYFDTNKIQKLKKKNSSSQNFLWKVSVLGLKFNMKTFALIHLEEERMSNFKVLKFLTRSCFIHLTAESKYSAEFACVRNDCIVDFRFELAFA